MQDPQNEERLVVNANYEIFVFALVVLSVLNSVIFTLLPISSENRQVIRIIDLGLSAFLMVDFLERLARAKHKRSFFFDFYGWLVLLGSLPAPGLRLARLLHMALLARKLKRSDYAAMGHVVIQQRSRSTLLVVILATIIVLEFSSLLILRAERIAPGANIKTASDALWWGIVTVATVGYGDRYPVTAGGRIVAVFVMFVGVGIFSVLTSFLSEWFLRPRISPNREPPQKAGAVSDDLMNQLERIRQTLERQERAQRQSHAELSARMAEIERALKGESRGDDH